MVLKICVICECQFEARTSAKTCSAVCKSTRERQVSDTWSRENPEKVKDKQRRWYDLNREKRLAISKNWKSRNPGKIRQKKRRYYAKHAEKLRAQKREKYWCEPEILRDRCRTAYYRDRDRYISLAAERVRTKRASIAQVEAQIALNAAEES